MRSSRSICLLFILGLSHLICAFANFAFAGGAPKAVLSEKVYNFGEVQQGTIVEHIFVLQNKGTSPLFINKVEFTGRFTTINTKKTTPPGQQRKIIMTIDTSELKGDIESGVIFHTNDPVNPNLLIKMNGKVKPDEIVFHPRAAIFISTFLDQTEEKSITIKNNVEKPLEIFAIESESKRFQASLQTVEKGKEYKLVVKTNPKAALGRSKDYVLLFTDNPSFPEIMVPVHVFVKGEVYNFPDNIDFGQIKLTKLKESPKLLDFLTQTILVKRIPGKGKDFQITLEHNIPFINIKKTPDSNSETYRLDITPIIEKMKPGKFDTFIRVKTNDKEVPELKIPVVGEVL